jgi:hypothetical protein
MTVRNNAPTAPLSIGRTAYVDIRVPLRGLRTCPGIIDMPRKHSDGVSAKETEALRGVLNVHLALDLASPSSW